jgi:2-polyprenyl-6-methoxyphenol hydroxylase-like FAD-dependent oxidoreductase
VLLSGLDDIVHFGKTFVRYEEAATGRIVVHFEDDTTAQGDVLVAADGGGSRVRRQYLPHAQRVDTGMVGIAGKVFLDTEGRRQVPPEFLGTLTLVAGMGGYSFFVAPQEIVGAAAGEFSGNDESANAGGHFDNTRSYLMWAFGARREKFDLVGDAEQVSGEPLRDVVLREMAARSWDDRFAKLVRLSDADTINAIAIRTSVPIAAWPAHRVTLLGDAIHAMTPYQGIGANIALKDAANLTRALVVADRGERPLLDAVGGYEAAMVDYGFRAVRRSLHAMHRSINDNPRKLIMSRVVLRLISRIAPLKRRMARAAGND